MAVPGRPPDSTFFIRHHGFRYGEPVNFDRNEGRVGFDAGHIRDLVLPPEYMDFIQHWNGANGHGQDAWFVARFPDSEMIFRFSHLDDFFGARVRNMVLKACLEPHEDAKIPPGYIYLGEASSEDFEAAIILLNVGHGANFGKIYVAMEGGAGDELDDINLSRGLGYVADNLADFMNHLKPRWAIQV